MASAFSQQASGNEQMVSGCEVVFSYGEPGRAYAMTNGGLGVVFLFTNQQQPVG
jgi:hypothetical protein